MANCKSKNRKAKASLKSQRICSNNETKSAFENFLFSLSVYHWFCKKRDPVSEVDDNQESSSMAGDQLSPTNSLQQVCGVGNGGDRIPTRRGGLRPSLPVPYNQPTTFEGASLSTLLGDGPLHPSRAEDREDTGAINEQPLSIEELELIFTPLPGAVPVDEEYLHPLADLLPLPCSSTLRHGQLPPLRCAVAAPACHSTTGLSARAEDPPVVPLTTPSSRPIPTRDAWISEQDDEDLKMTPKSDKKKKKEMKKKEKKMKKKLSAEKKKQSSKGDALDKIPTVKEWAKQQEKKRKAEEKLQKQQLKKEMKKQKKTAKENRKKEEQKQKAEKEAAKAKKAAEKEEKAAAEAKEKKIAKRAEFDEKMQKMLDDSDKQMAIDLERLAQEPQRMREEKAKRLMEKNAKTEKIIEALKEKLERKEGKVVKLREHRESRGHRATMLAVYKLNHKIDNYYRKMSSIKKMLEKLNKKVETRKAEIKELSPQLLEPVVTSEPEQEAVAGPSTPKRDTSEIEREAVDVNDDSSVLEMLCGLDSESEDSEDEEDELSS